MAIEGPDNMPLNNNDNFMLTCTVTLASEINDTMVQVVWADPNFNPYGSTNNSGIMLTSRDPILTYDNYNAVYTLSLNFSALQASQVGVYTCGAMFNDGTVVSSNFSVSVQGQYNSCLVINYYFIYYLAPAPTVSISESVRVFESTTVTLLCNVTFTPLDVDHVVSISWFGPNGLITMDNTQYIISGGMINLTTNGSSLMFTASLSDNETGYYCTASVGPDSNVNGFELIIPSDTVTSTSTTVTVESKWLFVLRSVVNVLCVIIVFS